MASVTTLIPDWPSFLQEHFGRRPFSCSLSAKALRELLEGFLDGDTADLLTTCRKPDNARYTSEEREEMERDLEAGRTLNLPYCFCRGARQLEAAFVDACCDRVNDIEVGIYVSRAGGAVAEWHCDAVHNFTIQLRGSKEWQLLPCGPCEADVASRGLFDAPRNRAEQLAERRSSTTVHGLGACADRLSLVAGSLLYVPPGHAHRVTPVSGHSLSVDVRLGHLSAGRWLSEALFASLSSATTTTDSSSSALGAAGLVPIGPGDTASSGGASNAAVAELARAVGTASASDLVGDLLTRCPLPRPLPCEPAHSDGLNRGASLTWLEARGCLAPSACMTGHESLALSRAVAMTLAERDGVLLVVRLLALSPLTSMEYMRFCIVCEAALRPPLARLIDGPARVDSLTALTPKPARLRVLLRCLLHANVLHTTRAQPASNPQEEAQPQAKRRRRG